MKHCQCRKTHLYFLILTVRSAERLTDPDDTPPGLEPTLTSLIKEIEQNLKDESKIIGQVFPNEEQVLGSFLQRIFQQSVRVPLGPWSNS